MSETTKLEMMGLRNIWEGITTGALHGISVPESSEDVLCSRCLETDPEYVSEECCSRCGKQIQGA